MHSYEHEPRADWITVAVVLVLTALFVGAIFLARSERNGDTDKAIEAAATFIHERL